MRNVNPDEILKRSDYLNLTDRQFVELVCQYCREKLESLDSVPEAEKLLQLQSFPKKEYEIFNLNVDGGKVFVLKTSEIYYIGDDKNKELYYSPNVAKELCKSIKQLNESAIDLVDAFKDEIEEAKKHIEELKELDNQEYGLARFMYSTFEDTEVLEQYRKMYETNKELSDENKFLKQELEKSSKNVEDLSNKLKFLLGEIEKNKSLLNVKNKNFFQKMAEKLKETLN